VDKLILNNMRFFSKYNKISDLIKYIENKNNSKLLMLTNNYNFVDYSPQIIHNDFLPKLVENYKIYKDKNIDLLIHTNGCIGYDFLYIIKFLLNHRKYHTINTYIPYYALSGGLALAFCGNNMYSSKYSLFSPPDTQVFLNKNHKLPFNIYKQYIMPNVSYSYYEYFNMIINNIDIIKNNNIFKKYIFDTFAHNYPFTYKDFIKLNLDIKSDMPKYFYNLIDILYENNNNDNNNKNIIFFDNNFFEVIKCLNNDNNSKLTFYYKPKTSDIYKIMSLTKIIANSNKDISLYPLFNYNENFNTIYYLLLILSNKKIYFPKNFLFKHNIQKNIRFTDNNKINTEINNLLRNQNNKDILNFINTPYFDPKLRYTLLNIFINSHLYLDINHLKNLGIPNLVIIPGFS